MAVNARQIYIDDLIVNKLLILGGGVQVIVPAWNGGPVTVNIPLFPATGAFTLSCTAILPQFGAAQFSCCKGDPLQVGIANRLAYQAVPDLNLIALWPAAAPGTSGIGLLQLEHNSVLATLPVTYLVRWV